MNNNNSLKHRDQSESQTQHNSSIVDMNPPGQFCTVRTAIERACRCFETHQIASPRLDAELLLAFVAQYSRVDLYLNYNKPLLPEEQKNYQALVKKRIQGTPVAYLLGKKDFWTLTLIAKEGVLIPRPDTETLVEQLCSAVNAWQSIHDKQPCRILEMGTGTAAIPLALCSSLKNIIIVSIDICISALRIAAKNIKFYSHLITPRENRIHLARGDRFDMLNDSTKFDFIVSNPPYIPTAHISRLQKEITHYEPRQALDGGEDGLDFYRYLFNQGKYFLKPEGQMLLEIGYNQAPDLEALLPGGWHVLQIVRDLQSHPRIWHGKRSE